MSLVLISAYRLRTGMMLAAMLALVMHFILPPEGIIAFSGEPVGVHAAPPATVAVVSSTLGEPRNRTAGFRAALDAGEHDHRVPCKSTCCGPACAAAVLVVPVLLPQRMAVATRPPLHARDILRDGVDPAGLNRPPNAPV